MKSAEDAARLQVFDERLPILGEGDEVEPVVDSRNLAGRRGAGSLFH